MRAVSVAILAIGFLVPGVLHAEEPKKFDGMENYCLFNSKTFSVGAVVRSMICVGPEQGTNKTSRAVWTRMDMDGDRGRNWDRDKNWDRNRNRNRNENGNRDRNRNRDRDSDDDDD